MSLFIIAGIMHSLFIVFLFTIKTPNDFKDKITSLYMFFLMIPLLIQVIMIKNPTLFPEYITHTLMNYFFLIHIPLLYGPFLNLYTNCLIIQKNHFIKQDLKHFLPFLSFSIILIIAGFNKNLFILTALISNIVSFISIMYYIYSILSRIKSHNINMKNYYSFKSNSHIEQWLIRNIFIFTVIFGYIIVSSITLHIINFQYTGIFNKIHYISLIVYMYLFSLISLQKPVLHTKNDYDKKLKPNKNIKYKKSGLKERDASSYLTVLENYMQKEKPFCNGDLTILDISKQLNIPRHYITQIINEKLHKNFYSYVNEYRINEAKEKILNDKYRDYTILRIAIESGFNSKSAFNTMFKKITNMSPSEYRKQYANK